jgi:hypothetical protein
MTVRHFAAFCCATLLLAPKTSLAQDLSKETAFTVRLISPVSTKTNRKGDKVTAVVQEPEAYRDDNLEGVIKVSKSGGRVKRTSKLLFAFDTLYHKGVAIPVSVQVVSVTNSKGQKNADEEGDIIKGSSWAKKLAFPVIVAIKGPNISFDSNSEFSLRLKQSPPSLGR